MFKGLMARGKQAIMQGLVHGRGTTSPSIAMGNIRSGSEKVLANAPKVSIKTNKNAATQHAEQIATNVEQRYAKGRVASFFDRTGASKEMQAMGAQSMGYQTASGQLERGLNRTQRKLEMLNRYKSKRGGNAKVDKRIADYENQINEMDSDKTNLMIDHYTKQAGHAWDAMLAGDATDKAIKFGTVGAGYFGANALLRGATGGGATYNSSGERDIMGIPFI